MAIVWGKLPADRDATDSRDWSGTLKISHGGLLVRHTIGFEDATDMLLPRTSLDTVAFQSVAQRMQSHCCSTACADGAPPEPLRASRQRLVRRLIKTGYCVPVVLQTSPEHCGGTLTHPRRHSAGA